MTATVPLLGTTLSGKVARAIHRLLGTVVGVGVAFILLLWAPPTWVLILAVAVLQIVTELFVARNYGIAVVAITPMALIMTHLGSPQPLSALASDRVLESLIGAATSVAVLFAIEPFRRDDVGVNESLG